MSQNRDAPVYEGNVARGAALTQSDEQLRSETGQQLDHLPRRLVARLETPRKGVPAMSAGLDLASIRSSSAVDRSEGRPVVRYPEQLRLHRALAELDMVDVVEELNEAARLKDLSAAEPILITTNGTILAGFGHWRSASLEGSHEVHCMEVPILEEESLRFILNHHKPRRGWNAFVRIRAALTQERDLQQRALDNMRAGGRYKGLANLPEAQHMDVRQQIADDAGVGTRNVGNVKTILKKAHPRLITALLNGTLSINRAMGFCKLPAGEQLEVFIRHTEDREIERVIRRSVARPKQEKTTADVATVLDALQQQEARQPGSVLLQVGRFQRTVILVGQDLLAGRSYSQKELDLHEIP